MIDKKLEEIFTKITEVSELDEVVGAILLEQFDIAIKLLKATLENEGTVPAERDISEQLALVTNILGIDLAALVGEIIQRDFADETSKEVDDDTLSFIVDEDAVDDYETFLKENKVKENLIFLKNEI